MTASFGATLAEWHDFYAAVAGIAAALVGLLFVALALRPTIMANAGPAGLRVWSGQTFHSFLVVLVLALIALIPDDDATTRRRWPISSVSGPRGRSGRATTTRSAGWSPSSCCCC